MDFAERAARNEAVVRGVNESIEAGAEMHDIKPLQRFHCECDREGCFEQLYIAPAEYHKIMEQRYHFAIAPDHLDPRVERVAETRNDYLVVEKIGEAREALEQQHPQERHR
jgi:hypothetical protein